MAKNDNKETANTAAAATVATPQLPADPMLTPPPAPMIRSTQRKDVVVPGIEVPGAAQRIARRDAVQARQRIVEQLKNVRDTQQQLAGILKTYEASKDVAAPEWAREGVSIDRVREFEGALRELFEKFTAA
jgi:hypothetical protein